MPAAATATVAAVGEAPHRARLGRNNSVSLYRHNLLTSVFCRASTRAPESGHRNNIIYFKRLGLIREERVPLESASLLTGLCRARDSWGPSPLAWATCPFATLSTRRTGGPRGRPTPPAVRKPHRVDADRDRSRATGRQLPDGQDQSRR